MAAAPTITEMVRATGLTATELEHRSGKRVHRQQFENILDGHLKDFPRSPDKMRGYAAALGVDEREVLLAFGREFGLNADENRSMLATMLPRSTGELTPAQAIALADLIRVFTLPLHRDENAIVDLHGCPPEEMRDIMNLWTELTTRAETATPTVARILQHLANSINQSIEDSKR